MSHWFEGWRPRAAKGGPVDGAYRQVKWIRPYRPGPWRVVAFLLGGVAFFIPMFSSLIVLLTAQSALGPRLLVSASLALIAIGVGIVVGRLFATGVYVNDSGVRVLTIRSMVTLPWTDVADLSDASARVPVLGLAFLPTSGHAVVLTTRDGGPVRTPVTSKGLDFFGRAQAYDAAALALERWWRDAPRD